jgi:16S rRNA (uracil1498-N3)-methyltransferase
LALPFFYHKEVIFNTTSITLDEATSKHIVQVLRMKIGEQLNLTNGLGDVFTCQIKIDNRKQCLVEVVKKVNNPKLSNATTIAISLLKNNTRFEWFLEKATEIGITQIVPLICNRTEKTTFKFERLHGILVSAMLQSQQCWLPIMQQPQAFDKYVAQQFNNTSKLIAHCESEETRQPLTSQLINDPINKLILIGPEGDFTQKEIELALQNNFVPVSLGNTRLRTETAAIVASTLLCS